MSGVLALAVAIGLVFGAHKLCDLIRAPRWFAKFLFIGAFLIITYFLAEDIVPESKKPWGYLGRSARRRNWNHPSRVHCV